VQDAPLLCVRALHVANVVCYPTGAVNTLTLLTLMATLATPPTHPWRSGPDAAQTVADIPLPDGFERSPVVAGSFGAWLRALPLKEDRTVHLFNGDEKPNQSAQHAVIDIDVGSKDLQQCADAVIRLRAEYQRASGREDEVCFKFTSGDPALWTSWKKGERPVITRKVSWKKSQKPDASYPSFRAYLESVFTYAGTASLALELKPADQVEPGDVFIQGGFPGHAVIVADAAQDPDGHRIFLLAQSYMPAQEIHVMINPQDSVLSPWYRAVDDGETLSTPEWTFEKARAMRFPEKSCSKKP